MLSAKAADARPRSRAASPQSPHRSYRVDSAKVGSATSRQSQWAPDPDRIRSRRLVREPIAPDHPRLP